jgi:hypothetical protein
MDKETEKLGQCVVAERACAKSGMAYQGKAGRWDLVEAMKDKDFKFEDVKKENLPEEMRKMNQEGQKTYIEKKAKEREDIKQNIIELSKKRDAYIQEEMKKLKPVGDAFDQVIIGTLRKQAEKKGFKFEE